MSTPIYDGLRAGLQRRDAGMAAAEAHADARIIAVIDAVIEGAIESGQPFSANTIRGLLPTTTSQGLVGARIRAFAARRPRVMERVGYEPSTLPSTNGHAIAVWKGVKRAEVAA